MLLFADFPITEVDEEEMEQAIMELEAIVGRQEMTNSQQLLEYGMYVQTRVQGYTCYYTVYIVT